MRVRFCVGVVAGTSLLVLATTGCTQHASPTVSTGSGQLQSVGDPAHVCVPAGHDALAVVSLDLVKNMGSGPVTVSTVSPVSGRGLEVVGASLVPDSDTAGFRGVAGSERGHVASPVGLISAGERATVQVTLRLTGKKGTADALQLSYTGGATPIASTVDTQMSITVLPEGSVCGPTSDPGHS